MKKIVCALFFCLFPSVGMALDLESAKQQGLVGETPSGYLESVPGKSSPDVKTLVKEVNAGRKKAYQKIAKKNGTSLSAVEQIGGKKAVNRTPDGQFVKRLNGSWEKK